MELNYKKPSPLLVSMVKKGAETISMYLQHRESAKLAIEQIIEQGRKEGIGDKQLGQMLREEMKNRGLSDRTIRKHLPAEFKNQNMVRKPRAKKDPLVKEWKIDMDLIKFKQAVNELVDEGYKKGYIVHDNRRVVDVYGKGNE